MKDILVPVSVGELVDKVTILQIKKQNIVDSAKLKNIEKELVALTAVCESNGIDLSHSLVAQLKTVNEALWKIEDDIREEERAKRFDTKFIELARAVYVTNDQRFSCKSALNAFFGSAFMEEKSYQPY